MKKQAIIIFLFLFPLILSAQKIKIGIFDHKNIQKILLEAEKGKYTIKAEGKKIYKLKANRPIILSMQNGNIRLITEKKEYNSLKNISLIGKKKSIISVNLIKPQQKVRKYRGDLTVYARQDRIKLINLPPFDAYLAGVVEAESGTKASKEYYKNQAIICRTYALKSWDKHKNAGFNLCDGVHCQAYKGISTQDKLIHRSVKRTKNLVILDPKNRLIAALFSANCGGQTNNSEMVWSSVIPYLRSVKDPYCIDQRQAHWEKNIPLQKFTDFLKQKGIALPDSLTAEDFAFTQPERKKYYTINNQEIKLSSIRFALGLRSTFFNIQPEDNQLHFRGRGYGHGVGMCQEGAMNMAKKGKNYQEIIRFYYTGVAIKAMSKAIDLPKFE